MLPNVAKKCDLVRKLGWNLHSQNLSFAEKAKCHPSQVNLAKRVQWQLRTPSPGLIPRMRPGDGPVGSPNGLLSYFRGFRLNVRVTFALILAENLQEKTFLRPKAACVTSDGSGRCHVAPELALPPHPPRIPFTYSSSRALPSRFGILGGCGGQRRFSLITGGWRESQRNPQAAARPKGSAPPSAWSLFKMFCSYFLPFGLHFSWNFSGK